MSGDNDDLSVGQCGGGDTPARGDEEGWGPTIFTCLAIAFIAGGVVAVFAVLFRIIVWGFGG